MSVDHVHNVQQLAEFSAVLKKILVKHLTLFSDVPASAAYFASYELIQRGLQGPDRLVLKSYLWPL